MNEHDAHTIRVAQINALLPTLLRQGSVRSCLYVGATPWRFQLGAELHAAGYEMTLLEVDKDNAYFYDGHPWLTGGILCGDVRYLEKLSPGGLWDTIVWWHGPEHIAHGDLERTLQQLEMAATNLVVLAAPWGENAQPMVEGNAHQEHKAHLQPEDFERLGYTTATCGVQGDLSTWPHILAWKAKTIERIVYTAIFGEYDTLLPVTCPGKFVCFTDKTNSGNFAEGWEIITVERTFDNPQREARMYKVLAHQLFPNVKESLWLDGNCDLLVPPNELFSYLDSTDIAMPRHPSCKTLADEASFIIQLGKASKAQVVKQMGHYLSHDLPACATTWLLRRHTDAIRMLNDAWWSDLSVYTLRDQLSLPPAMERLCIKPRLIDIDLYDNDLVRVHQHRGAK